MNNIFLNDIIDNVKAGSVFLGSLKRKIAGKGGALNRRQAFKIIGVCKGINSVFLSHFTGNGIRGDSAAAGFLEVNFWK